jgi:hypothetical protein
MNDINSIQLKRQKNNRIVIFPGHNKNVNDQKAKDFVEKANADRLEKFNFIKIRLDKLKEEFKKEFNCEADYFIFNSIK